MEEKPKKKLFTATRMFLLAVFLLALTLWRCFQIYKVEGISMEPTLQPGQGLLLVRIPFLAGGIHDGDIVVITDESGKEFMIKRIYKLAGESVAEEGLQPEGLDAPFPVPDGTIYVLGDNRDHSEDSRSFGPVPLSRLVGKALFVPGAARDARS